jgi:hypothetical protein
MERGIADWSFQGPAAAAASSLFADGGLKWQPGLVWGRFWRRNVQVFWIREKNKNILGFVDESLAFI